MRYFLSTEFIGFCYSYTKLILHCCLLLIIESIGIRNEIEWVERKYQYNQPSI